MNITGYTVVGSNASLGNLIVKYEVDGKTIDLKWTFQVPIINGAFPTGKDLDALVIADAPTDRLERTILVAAANFENLAALANDEEIVSHKVRTSLEANINAVPAGMSDGVAVIYVERSPTVQSSLPVDSGVVEV